MKVERSAVNWNGRPARFAGTLCTDPAGRGYVVNDSVRFLMYLN